MAKPQKKQQERTPVTGMERLTLRVSSMINHPTSQLNRTVTIHRLDTDGQKEWDELLTVLSGTDGIELTIEDDDEAITLRWEAASDEDRPVEVDDIAVAADPTPF